MPERAALAKRVTEFRKAAKESQLKFAEHTGISADEISLIERGAVNVTLDTLQKLAAYMDTTVSELLYVERDDHDMEKHLTPIYDLLRRLGITANYIGFLHAAYAVSLCADRPERLLLVTKWLYPEVAKQYKTTWKAVERNLRRTVCIAWQENRPLLEQLACRTLSQKPRTSQFLAILAASLDTGPLAVHGLSEAVTFAGEDDNMGMMDEPVYESGRETVVAKDGVPLAELQIGGNDEAPALVTV